jgi:hypothetical protein
MWAACFECNKFMGYLRLCILIGIDYSYPKSHYTSFLDLQFKSYGVLKISASVRARGAII